MSAREVPAAVWARSAWVAAAVMATAVSLSLVRIPIQVTDSLLVMLQVQPEASAAAVIRTFLGEDGFLRPLYPAQVKVLLDLSGGSYFVTFKAFHVALVVALFIVVTMAARVRARTEFIAFAFALAVLTGLHTFIGNVWEAYPINHYLEIAVFCTAALVLGQSRGGWWIDALASLLFVAAALTLESGLIVWVVFVVGRFVDLRGVSWRGVAVVTLLLAGYLYLRFVYLNTGTPTLAERSTGFGFGRLEPADAIARFGEAPYLFYLYNVASSFLSVVLSEPRGGTWELTSQLRQGAISPGLIVNVLSVLVGTGLLVWFTAVRWRRWLARQFEHVDQLVLVALATIAGNAAVCFVYTKDEIMSTGGVFYALAVFAAASHLLAIHASAPRRALAGALLTVALVLGSTAWTIRSAGLHYHLARMGFNIRSEWGRVDEWLRDQNIVLTTPEATTLVEDLRVEAMDRPMLNPVFLPRWGAAWFK